jgi:LysR family glycine cleavage system transcriptional activator
MKNKYQHLPLTALRTFEAAARLHSFKQAAQELNVTPATVSNQIRRLERDWNCPLFVRKTRQLVLTDTGRTLARVVGRAFDDIRAEIESRVTRLKKTVTLAIGPIFASRWLIPRLDRLRRQHPSIELLLHHGPRIAAAANMHTDIAVDWGEGGWSGLEAVHLFDIRYRPILSPILAQRLGGIATPADLARFTILHQHDRSEWRAWLQLAGVPGLELQEESVIDDSNVIVQAAIDGQGVALGTFPFLQPEVDSGRLACPLQITLKPKRSYHLLTRAGVSRNPEVDAVCHWLQNEAADSRASWSDL